VHCVRKRWPGQGTALVLFLGAYPAGNLGACPACPVKRARAATTALSAHSHQIHRDACMVPPDCSILTVLPPCCTQYACSILAVLRRLDPSEDRRKLLHAQSCYAVTERLFISASKYTHHHTLINAGLLRSLEVGRCLAGRVGRHTGLH
jgi:hypothetical protein